MSSDEESANAPSPMILRLEIYLAAAMALASAGLSVFMPYLIAVGRHYLRAGFPDLITRLLPEARLRRARRPVPALSAGRLAKGALHPLRRRYGRDGANPPGGEDDSHRRRVFHIRGYPGLRPLDAFDGGGGHLVSGHPADMGLSRPSRCSCPSSCASSSRGCCSSRCRGVISKPSPASRTPS